MVYYEKSANFNQYDRNYIIQNGFQEWLLAAISDQVVDTAAARCRRDICKPRHEQQTDIVTLIANLIGGVEYGAD